MLERIPRYFIHRDSKGVLEGLVNFGTWREINLVRSEAGAVRGNHFHKRILELFIILEGKIEITLERVLDGKRNGRRESAIVIPGDVVQVGPSVLHTFNVLEDSVWINVLSETLDPETPDIWRLPEKTPPG